LSLRLHLNAEIAARIAADMLMVNLSLQIALISRYLWLVGIEGSEISAQATFHNYVRAYLQSFWLLTLVSLMIFYLSGFYTHGRYYEGRYKVLVVTQAVSLSYLVFSLLVFFLWDVISFPRSVLLLGWLLTLVFLIGARLCWGLWVDLVQTESHLSPVELNSAELHHVLIIGGAGYIGSALLPKLLDKGYRVRVLDLLLFGQEPIADVINHPHLEVLQADFRQVEKVVSAMRDVDAVIHLGAIVGDPACALDEELTIQINLMATRMIAEVAKGRGVERFIFASTCSVYGASDEVLDEHSSLKPVSLYARSKIASERVLMQMTDDCFAPVILRFGTIYGLSGRTRFDLVINLLTAKAVMDGKITVFGGDQWRPFLHVEDAALAVLKALEAPLILVGDQVFNVGCNAQNYEIKQIGSIIHDLVPSAELINEAVDGDRRDYRVNFNKIRSVLGFVPKWTIEQGVQQIIEAINCGAVRDYRDARYSNARFLSDEGSSRLIHYTSGWAYELLAMSDVPPEEVSTPPAKSADAEHYVPTLAPALAASAENR
jgi:nucleoside-diphosphate-sugar epimerase